MKAGAPRAVEQGAFSPGQAASSEHKGGIIRNNGYQDLRVPQDFELPFQLRHELADAVGAGRQEDNLPNSLLHTS